MVQKVRSVVLGGLGNQLFNYSASVKIANELKSPLEVDLRGIPSRGQQKGSSISNLDLQFDIELKGNSITNYLHKYLCFSYLRNGGSLNRLQKFWFDSVISNFEGLQTYDKNAKTLSVLGYFRKPDCVGHMGLSQPFRLRHKGSLRFRQIANLCAQEDTIVLHMRLGDSLMLSGTRGILGSEYFISAIDLLVSKSPNISRVIIFSDDPVLAKNKLNGEISRKITQEFIGDELDSAEVLVCMSSSKNLIISNSTLSWWAAKKGSKNVVAPSIWKIVETKKVDMLDPEWLVVDPDWEKN